MKFRKVGNKGKPWAKSQVIASKQHLKKLKCECED